VHKLGHDEVETTKELLDITTRHTPSEEAVGAIFVLGDGKMVPCSSRGALLQYKPSSSWIQISNLNSFRFSFLSPIATCKEDSHF
jgi:hypothetical protein